MKDMIAGDEEYNAALAEIETLMDVDGDDPKFKRLMDLVWKVDQYEKITFPIFNEQQVVDEENKEKLSRFGETIDIPGGKIEGEDLEKSTPPSGYNQERALFEQQFNEVGPIEGQRRKFDPCFRRDERTHITSRGPGKGLEGRRFLFTSPNEEPDTYTDASTAALAQQHLDACLVPEGTLRPGIDYVDEETPSREARASVLRHYENKVDKSFTRWDVIDVFCRFMWHRVQVYLGWRKDKPEGRAYDNGFEQSSREGV